MSVFLVLRNVLTCHYCLEVDLYRCCWLLGCPGSLESCRKEQLHLKGRTGLSCSSLEVYAKLRFDCVISSFLTVRLKAWIATGMRGVCTYHVNSTNGLLAQCTGIGGVEEKRQICRMCLCLTYFSHTCRTYLRVV